MASKSNPIQVPLYFEYNKGQIDPEFKYLCKTKEQTTLYTNNKIDICQKGSAFSIRFSNSNPNVNLIAEKECLGKINYFIGKEPSNWVADIPTFSNIRYQQLYSMIDMVCYGNNKNIEFDFEISPLADVNDICFIIEGTNSIKKDEQGDLCILLSSLAVKIRKPYCYQEHQGGTTEIEGNYVIENENQIKFKIEDYDKRIPLTIDPVLYFSTYLGGNETLFGEGGYGIESDDDGNIYIVGYTTALDYPTNNAYQSALQGQSNVVVSKFNSTGTELMYSTYIGGDGADFGIALTLDNYNNIYITGNTSSNNFPTVNPYQATLLGGINAFISKLSPNGNVLLYSSYLGGSKQDFGTGIKVDTTGNIYVGGYTNSIDYKIQNAYQENLLGIQNAFITKLDSSGTSLIFSTYLGGKGQDLTSALEIDSENNVYITGNTNSFNFPIKNAVQPALGGKRDIFITEIDSSGTELVFSTYLGGKNDDFGTDIAVDHTQNIYVVGSTQSNNIPIKNALQSSLLGESNTCIVKLSPNGTSIVFSTYLGGSGFDYANCISIDGDESFYVTGGTTSLDFPIIYPIQPNNAGTTDAFITKIKNDGSQLLFSSYLGGADVDIGNCISCGKDGSVRVVGVTYSSNFNTLKAYQPNLIGTVDVFIAELKEAGRLLVTKTASQDKVYVGELLTYEVSVQNTGYSAATSVVLTDILSEDCQLIDINVSVGSVSVLGQRVVWNIDNIPEGGEVSAKIVVKALSCGELINTVRVTADNNLYSEASTTTTVVLKLSTGPVLRDCKPYYCSKDKDVNITSLSLIENTTSQTAYINVYLYDLEVSNTIYECSCQIAIKPFTTSTVYFSYPPCMYKLVFDNVLQGVFPSTTIQGSVHSKDGKGKCVHFQTNTFSYNDLINVTNC